MRGNEMSKAGPSTSGMRPILFMMMAIAVLSLTGFLPADMQSPSAAVEGASPPDTTPPAAVEGLFAADARDGKVNLTWNASTEADFAYYAIYYDNVSFLTIGNRTAFAKLNNITARNLTVTGLTDGTEYFFAVTAVDTGGNEDRTAVSVSATPTASPVPDTIAPPAVLGITAADANDGKVSLSWVPVNVSDFDHYSIYMAVQPGAPVAGLTPAVKIADMSTGITTLTGLSDNTTYYFAVTAVDKSGNENRTVLAAATATPTPSQPEKGTGGAGPKAEGAPYYFLAVPIIVILVAVATYITLLIAYGGPDDDAPGPGVGERKEEWTDDEDLPDVEGEGDGDLNEEI